MSQNRHCYLTTPQGKVKRFKLSSVHEQLRDKDDGLMSDDSEVNNKIIILILFLFYFLKKC